MVLNSWILLFCTVKSFVMIAISSSIPKKNSLLILDFSLPMILSRPMTILSQTVHLVKQTAISSHQPICLIIYWWYDLQNFHEKLRVYDWPAIQPVLQSNNFEKKYLLISTPPQSPPYQRPYNKSMTLYETKHEPISPN